MVSFFVIFICHFLSFLSPLSLSLHIITGSKKSPTPYKKPTIIAQFNFKFRIPSSIPQKPLDSRERTEHITNQPTPQIRDSEILRFCDSDIITSHGWGAAKVWKHVQETGVFGFDLGRQVSTEGVEPSGGRKAAGSSSAGSGYRIWCCGPHHGAQPIQRRTGVSDGQGFTTSHGPTLP